MGRISEDKQPFRYICNVEKFIQKDGKPLEKPKENGLYQWLITPADCKKCIRKGYGCRLGVDKIRAWNEKNPEKEISIQLPSYEKLGYPT